MAEVVEWLPHELTWLILLCALDPLRKFCKLNAEAMALILHELDFWVPFVTMCLGAFFASASFAHEGGAAATSIMFVIFVTVNTLLGKHSK